MNLSESESVPNEYNVYYSTAGDRYIVIGELSIDNIRDDSQLTQFTESNYAQIEMMYWVTLCFMIFYLITTFILTPLFGRCKRYFNFN